MGTLSDSIRSRTCAAVIVERMEYSVHKVIASNGTEGSRNWTWRLRVGGVDGSSLCQTGLNGLTAGLGACV